MSKHKNLAVTNAAHQAAQIALPGLAGRRVAALEAEGARIAAEIAANGTQRSLQLVSAKDGFSALIKHGNKTFQFEGDSFAVSTHD